MYDTVQPCGAFTLTLGLSWQEYWWVTVSSLADPRIEPTSPEVPALLKQAYL